MYCCASASAIVKCECKSSPCFGGARRPNYEKASHAMSAGNARYATPVRLTYSDHPSSRDDTKKYLEAVIQCRSVSAKAACAIGCVVT